MVSLTFCRQDRTSFVTLLYTWLQFTLSIYRMQVILAGRSFFYPLGIGASLDALRMSPITRMVLASEAASVGIETDQTTGWVPYPIPNQVSLYTRMHLSEDGVRGLIAHLQSWLDTGSFKGE